MQSQMLWSYTCYDNSLTINNIFIYKTMACVLVDQVEIFDVRIHIIPNKRLIKMVVCSLYM